MGKFERGSRFGSGRGRGSRNDRGDRLLMHDAICNDCGKRCQVPFRPTGNKPVYCSDCFNEHGGGSDRLESRNKNHNFGDRGDRQKFNIVCAKCGKKCQVPFRPTGNKPVYCDDCFDRGGDDNYEQSKKIDFSGQLTEVSAKLDRILEILISTSTNSIEIAEQKVDEKTDKIKSTKSKDDQTIIAKTALKKEKKILKPKVATSKKTKSKK